MNPRDHASTFAKGLAVLSCFEGGRRDLSMADIAERTGFDRAVARRLCLTLEAEGYLIRVGKSLRLTPKVLALAGGYLSAEGIGRWVQPVLNDFAERLNGEIALVVLEGARALYVARSAVASARLSFGFSVGSALPLLPTAAGTMLLACCDEARRDAVLSAEQPKRFTPSTQTEARSLRARIAEAEAQGYAWISGEFETGAAGLAVAAPRLSGVPAVLATSASVPHLQDDDNRARALDILFQAAHHLRRA